MGIASSDRVQEILPELFDETPGTMADAGALKIREEQAIKEAMERFGQDKARVAEYLGISATTLWRRLKEMDKNPGTNLPGLS